MKNVHLIALLAVAFVALGCQSPKSGKANDSSATTAKPAAAEAEPPPEGLAKATFAGGCFWCMEPPFDRIEGVFSTTSGYTGGPEKNPTYEQVASGQTGHVEAVQVAYDPEVVSYETLLEVFWRNIDPTQDDGQFVDRGHQYRTYVFYHDDEQKRLAEASKQKLAQSGKFEKPIVTQIVPAETFYPAEEYHQDFYEKSPARYKQYRRGSGRDQFLDRVWGEEARGEHLE